jgi:hypothetical protein
LEDLRTIGLEKWRSGEVEDRSSVAIKASGKGERKQVSK